MLVTSCGKESPFELIQEEGKGTFHKSALGFDVRDEEMVQTRGENNINIDDFKIIFTKVGASSPSVVYRYGDMPDVVTLEKGSYTVRAEYGEDVEADWNKPYYVGESDSFTILPDKITDDIGEIVCRLQNVKVSILFGPNLKEQMGEDAVVEVRVNDSGTAEGSSSLNFTIDDQERGNCGYFKHVEGVSLVATFKGDIEGLRTVQTKSYSDIKKGHHYKITFKLISHAGESKGDLSGNMKVDASVTVTDVERNVDIEEDQILDDSERPVEKDPEDPNIPGPDDPSAWQGPTVKAEPPLTIPSFSELTPDNDGIIRIECTQDISKAAAMGGQEYPVALTFMSKSGFEEFDADIVSDDLTPEELEGMDLNSHLDLINPATPEMAETLDGLGFPVYVEGKHEAAFDITQFVPLLAAFEPKPHKFIIHVKDAKGEIIVNLVLNFKQ